MREQPIESIVYKGHTINIYFDTDSSDPRKMNENAAEMYCWHRRYNIGDKHKYEGREELFAELAGVEYEEQSVGELIKLAEDKGHIIKTIYMYDHSGITISHGSFSCGWDSGVVGYHVMRAETIVKEWAGDKQRAENYMKAELEEYDNYLTGQVYGYEVEETGDSCWGFNGYWRDSGLLEEAQSAIDWNVKQKTKKHLQQLKSWIQNKVPLVYRKPLQLI